MVRVRSRTPLGTATRERIEHMVERGAGAARRGDDAVDARVEVGIDHEVDGPDQVERARPGQLVGERDHGMAVAVAERGGHIGPSRARGSARTGGPNGACLG